MASELEFYVFDEPYESARREALPGSQDRRLVHRGLPHPADHQGGGPDPRDPQRHGSRRHPGRVLQGRMGPGPGGAEPALCRGARDGRPPRHLQERRQGDRALAGQVRDLHGQMGLRPRRQQLPHPWLARGRRDGAPVFTDGHGRQRAVPPVPRRPAGARPRHDLLPRALHQLLQALPGRLVCADQGGLEPRQPHRRLPGARRTAPARVECRIPGADVNPYLAFAALLAAGLHGIEQRLELEPAFAGDAYKAEVREVPKTLREALDWLDRSQCCARLSATR